MKIENLMKTYVNKKGRKCPALNGFTAEIPDKGVTFILGKSGCGKSTLLNLIGCLDDSDSGKIIIGETDITKLDSKATENYRSNNIGFIFQNFNLFDQLNVYDNIIFNVKPHTGLEEKVDTYLEKLGILECKFKKINELSGGQQQRVTIARALIKDCKILLADEPTGNLDENNGRLIFEILKEIAKDRMVLIVSHDTKSAFQYGDCIIEMQDGMVHKITDNRSHVDTANLAIDITNTYKKLPIKTNAKLSVSFMIKKKLKMMLNIVLLTISLAVMGVTFMCYNFDFGSSAADVVIESENQYMDVFKGYNNENSKKFVITELMRPIDNDTVKDITERYNLTDIDEVYSINGMMISATQSSNKYFRNYVSSAIGSDEKSLVKYGFKMLYGTYAIENTEVTLTDFLANSIAMQNPFLIASILNLEITDMEKVINNDFKLIEALKTMDSDTLSTLFTQEWEKVINQPETLKHLRQNFGMLLLNNKVKFGSNQYLIKGIIDTGYYEKFGEILNGNKRDQALEQELFYNSLHLYNSFFVSRKNVSNIYNGDSFKYGNLTTRGYSTFYSKDQFSELKDNEIFMSNNMFRKVFGEEFDHSKIGEYKYSNKLALTSNDGSFSETVYQGELKNVIGVFDTIETTTYEIIMSDSAYIDYRDSMTYRRGITFSMPNDKEVISDMINYMRDKDMAFNHYLTYYIYEIADILEIFKMVFGIISAVLCVFSIALMYNYFSMLISSQQKEIGIMRALGLPNRQIMKIYTMCSAMLILITVFIAWGVLAGLAAICNSAIVEKIVWYMNSGSFSSMNILRFTVWPFLITGIIGCLVTVVSIIFPITRIKKMRPIDAIRKD